MFLLPFSAGAQSIDTGQTNTYTSYFIKKPLQFAIPAGMVGLGFFALKKGCFQQLNHSVRHEILEMHPDINNHIEDQMRFLPVASTFLLQALGVKGTHNMKDKLMLFAISTAILDQSVGKFKKYSNEIRPDGSNNRSFPSGHTTTAFAAAEFMRREYKDLSPWLVAGAYTTAAATGFLRVYHNKHWLSDVIAGAGLGVISTDLAYLGFDKIKCLQGKSKPQQDLVIFPSYQSQTIGITATLQLR